MPKHGCLPYPQPARITYNSTPLFSVASALFSHFCHAETAANLLQSVGYTHFPLTTEGVGGYGWSARSILPNCAFFREAPAHCTSFTPPRSGGPLRSDSYTLALWHCYTKHHLGGYKSDDLNNVESYFLYQTPRGRVGIENSAKSGRTALVVLHFVLLHSYTFALHLCLPKRRLLRQATRRFSGGRFDA